MTWHALCSRSNRHLRNHCDGYFAPLLGICRTARRLETGFDRHTAWCASSVCFSTWRLEKSNWRALCDLRGDALGVPIGQPHATMGFRFGDLAGVGRSVNAVTIRRQVDPHRADWIVRTRFDFEGFCGMDALEVI